MCLRWLLHMRWPEGVFTTVMNDMRLGPERRTQRLGKGGLGINPIA
jgi:hypothetical protein